MECPACHKETNFFTIINAPEFPYRIVQCAIKWCKAKFEYEEKNGKAYLRPVFDGHLLKHGTTEHEVNIFC